MDGVRGHVVLAELRKFCESSDSAVRAHGVVLDAIDAAGSCLTANNDHV